MRREFITIMGFIFLTMSACDLGWKVHQMEKILDKLDLDLKPGELTKKFDQLENSIRNLPDSLGLDYFIEFVPNGLMLNGEHIDSMNINIHYLTENCKNCKYFSNPDLNNIIELYFDLKRNHISIGQFRLNYSCNEITEFGYKEDMLDESLKYYRRELYIKRIGFESDCIPHDMYVVDSLENICLLKPIAYKNF